MLTAGLLDSIWRHKIFEVLKHLLQAGRITRYQKTGRLGVDKDVFAWTVLLLFPGTFKQTKLVNYAQFHTSSPLVFQLYIPHLYQLCLSYAGMCLFVHPHVQFSNHVQVFRRVVVSPISKGCHLYKDATYYLGLQQIQIQA